MNITQKINISTVCEHYKLGYWPESSVIRY